MDILKEVLDRIRPSDKEEHALQGAVCSFLDKLNKGLVNSKAILGGSAAKGTWLRGMSDIDIFFCFDFRKYAKRDSELAGILEKHLKKRFAKVQQLHGSRDYFQVKSGRYVFEIVPILGIDDAGKAVNITDVSPLHAAWVRKHLKPGLADEIRLFKAFCKAQKVYGAESYIRGLSGYVCEILVINYGSFMKTVRAIGKWKATVIIDPEKHYRKKDPRHELNLAKVQSPLIIIDPVQKDRNASAVLSSEVFARLIDACRGFQKKPSMYFFVQEKVTPALIRKKAGKSIPVILLAVPSKGKKDVVGGRLVKSLEYLKTQFTLNDFTVVQSGWSWDKDALLWFYVKEAKLPSHKIVPGPPQRSQFHAQRFMQKHKDVFVKREHLYAREKRPFATPLALARHLVSKDSYLKERTKKRRLV